MEFWILLASFALLSILALAVVPLPFRRRTEGAGQTVTDLIKKVRKIEVKAKRLSNQIFSGEYHSAFKGRGMSFSEVREYQFGDDVRNIDWNVTARFNQPFVKVFEEERELTVMLLVDVSQSAYFGTAGQTKSELITELCAIIAISAINNNDKVGAILFSDDIERFIPPKKGKTHILRIINELYAHEPTSNKTDIRRALEYFSNATKRKSIAFLISDFIGPSFKNTLDLVSRRHDLTAIHVYDPAERELPQWGLVHVADAETGEKTWLETNGNQRRADHRRAFEEHVERQRTDFRRSGAGWMSVRTDRPYTKTLMDYFRRRA